MLIANTNIPKLKTMDAETLMATPLPPVDFVVDALIAQGLYLLVGDSKIGKSWLTLQLCLNVAKGEDFWELQTKQGNVLYLCLEDNFQRLQNRLFEIADEGHKNLELAILAQDIARGLIVQIEDFISEQPATKMVVIDTLQKVRGMQVDMSGTYANDYREMGILKSLADKHKITVLLVHHTSKRPNESDPFKKISGTTAIMGASDGCMVMTKDNPFDKRAKLAVTGRDIESKVFSVVQNENFIWEVEETISVSEASKRAEPPVIGAVEKFIADNGDWTGTATALSSFLTSYLPDKLSPQYITCKINQFHLILQERGIIYQTKRTAQQRTIILSKLKAETSTAEAQKTMTCHGEHSCLSATLTTVPLKTEKGRRKIA